MVQFCKTLTKSSHKEWKFYYLNYKILKKIIKHSTNPTRIFQHQLNLEIEKVVLFYLSIQGQLATQLMTINRGIDSLFYHNSGTCIKNRQFIISSLYQQYVTTGQTLFQFVQYIELNTIGLRKILKKHDKNRNPKLMNYYLNTLVGKSDCHLYQLFQYEGVSALVSSIKNGLKKLHELEEECKFKNFHSRENNKDWKISVNFATQDINNYSDYIIHDVDASLEDKLEPILKKINLARQQLYQSTKYAKVLAIQSLITDIEEDESLLIGAQIMDEKTVLLSSYLNLCSTFLYMTNYYIIAPTSGHYALQLGFNEAFSGFMIGMTPIAALASSILYSYWANYNYKSALLCASLCCFVGNIFYSLALPMNNINLVMIGRLLNGLGGARAINRRFISDVYHREERTSASANFVTAGALGMSAGPMLASILSFLPLSSESKIISHGSVSGWVMAILWFIYYIFAWSYFEEPERNNRNITSITKKQEDRLEEQQPMLVSRDIQKSIGMKNLHPPLYKNIPVINMLFIYFVLKLVLECQLSSTATITSIYFSWNPMITGIFLALLGLLMFPANFLISYLSQTYDDRDIILYCLYTLLIASFGMINYYHYTLFQYLLFSIIIFLSTNLLECVNMSLLSKVMPKYYNIGTWNSGLLATEAGTLGRAVGDSVLSMIGLHMEGIYLVDFVFAPLGVVIGVTVVLTLGVYKYLVDPEEEDDDEESELCVSGSEVSDETLDEFKV